MSANFFNSITLFLSIGITVCSVFWKDKKAESQILPPLRNSATENRGPLDAIPAIEHQSQERNWNPFRADPRPNWFAVRPENDPSDHQEMEKKEWQPVLKMGQMGNMRSARRFEMESRPSPFNRRPQVFFDPDPEQQTNENEGILDRMSQRSQQAWSNTTSWFGERNQSLRQRANQSWQGLARPLQNGGQSSRSEDRSLFPRPFVDRQPGRSDLPQTDRF